MSSRAWQFGLACGLAGAGDVWPCGPTPLEAELSWPFGRPWQMDVGAGELACGNRSDLWQRDMDEGALRNLRLLITYTCPNPLAHLPILTHINTQVRTLRALWAVRPQCRDATHAGNLSVVPSDMATPNFVRSWIVSLRGTKRLLVRSFRFRTSRTRGFARRARAPSRRRVPCDHPKGLFDGSASST